MTNGFIGTIGYIKGNLMCSSSTSKDITDSWGPGNVYAKGNLIPIMTSNSAPKGICSMFRLAADSGAYSYYNINHVNTATRYYPSDTTQYYKAFDGNSSTYATFGSALRKQYIFVQYDFERSLLVDTLTFNFSYSRLQNKNIVDYQLNNGTWVNGYEGRTWTGIKKVNDRITAIRFGALSYGDASAAEIRFESCQVTAS